MFKEAPNKTLLRTGLRLRAPFFRLLPGTRQAIVPALARESVAVP